MEARTSGYSKRLTRSVALHGNTITMPHLGEVIPGRVMLGATIIPKSHRIGLPTKAALEIHTPSNVVIKHLQNVMTFCVAELHYPGCEG